MRLRRLARIGDASLPPRLEQVGERRGQSHARLPHRPAKTAERRTRELVERDQRRIEQRVEPQLHVARAHAELRLLVEPMHILPWLAERVTGSEQPLRRHAEAYEERARAGLDAAIASARPLDVHVAAPRDRAPLARKLGPVPELRIPCIDVARHETGTSPFRKCAAAVVDCARYPS